MILGSMNCSTVFGTRFRTARIFRQLSASILTVRRCNGQPPFGNSRNVCEERAPPHALEPPTPQDSSRIEFWPEINAMQAHPDCVTQRLRSIPTQPIASYASTPRPCSVSRLQSFMHLKFWWFECLLVLMNLYAFCGETFMDTIGNGFLMVGAVRRHIYAEHHANSQTQPKDWNAPSRAQRKERTLGR